MRGRLIAVYGAKRSLGASTVARALAIAYGELGAPARTALAELDPRVLRRTADGADGASRRGTSAVALRTVAATLVPRSTGEWAFARGRAVRDAVVPDAPEVVALLDELRGSFGHTVVDLEHRLNERTLPALDAAEHILVVTQLTVPALRATQRALLLFRRFGYPDDKLCVVLNRYRADDLITTADAASALKREICWRLPDDQVLAGPRAIVRTVPFGDAIALLSSARALATCLSER